MMDINAFIDGLDQRSAQAIKSEEGDYIVDGLLYCHKCHTAKQTRIVAMGRVFTPYCLCKCESAKRDAEEQERKRQDFLMEIKRMRSVGFPDSEMSRWTFARDDRKNERISTIARKYVENFDEMLKKGKGLLFFGSVGTGKTFISACIANALIDQGHPCMVTNFARLVNTLSGMYEGKQEYLDNLNMFKLLIIDDLASERDTEYMNETVQNIIDARYRSGLPLIITTNLTADDLKHPADIRKQRVYSRLFEMCVPVEVKGQDRRKQKLIEDHDDLKDLLGL